MAKAKKTSEKSSKKDSLDVKSTKKQKLAPSKKEPSTMEELIESTQYNLHGLKKGQELEGAITEVSKKAIMIDIGAKTEGMIINREYSEVRDFVPYLKIGDKIRAMVLVPEDERGQILLSLRNAATVHKWDLLEQYLKTGEPVEARGLEVNKGGLIARIFNIRGFIPASQFGRKYLGKLSQLYNRVLKVRVIEVDKGKNRLIFSEKAVSEAEVMEKQKTALQKIKIGGTYEGVVSGVMPFGVFVNVQVEKKPVKSVLTAKKGLFLEGLVHISEISWEKVDNVAKMFKVGDKIKVKVLAIDQSSARLNLSIKQLTADPWDNIEKDMPKDKKVEGKISRLVAFGAFVQLETGIEGLIHISKIPAEYEIKVGQKVKVYIESVDKQKRRMSLGLVLTEKPVGYK